METGDENAEAGDRTAAGDRDAARGHAGAEGAFAAEDRRDGEFHAYLCVGGSFVLRRQRPPQLRSGGAVQTGPDSATAFLVHRTRC